MAVTDKLNEMYQQALEKAGNEKNSCGFSSRETVKLIHDIAQELSLRGSDVKDALPDYADGVVRIAFQNPFLLCEINYLEIRVNQDKPMKSNEFVPIAETAQISIRICKQDVDSLAHPFGVFAGKHWLIGSDYLGNNVYNFGTYKQDEETATRFVNKFNAVISNWKTAVEQNKENFKNALD